MDFGRSVGSPSHTPFERTEEERSPFKASLRDKLDCWVGNLPPESDPSFRSLIQRDYGIGNPRHPRGRLFVPKDQHCGIWNDAPNRECHASFGDQGTTASVSCYGNLMQMSQFLGAGHAGIFSLDHKSTAKPYLIDSRAEDLNKLGSGHDSLSFGVLLPDDFLPDNVPEVRWVNWRWPRYEWEILHHDIRLQVSIQWLVRNNTVFQQIVVTNTGTSSIDDFRVITSQHMLIRDLDYLQGSSYKFNEDDSGSYIRGLGPNNFSWITANILDTGETVKRPGSDSKGKHAPNFRFNHTHHQSSSQDHPEHTPPSMDRQSINQHQHGTEECETTEKSQGHSWDETVHPSSDEELWRTRRITDAWSAKDPHAVVSIMSLFVNGAAVKMGMEPRPIYGTIGANGSDSNVLEITAAYRLIVTPKDGVHWKNFLIPAETADVSAMLSVETEQIWGYATTDDRELGLSMVDLSKQDVKQDASGEGHTTQDLGTVDHGVQESIEVHEDTVTIPDSQMEVKAGVAEASTAAEASNKHNAAQDTSSRSTAGDFVGNSQGPSPINAVIEYLTWRHMEHILSVCTIPLEVPPLSHTEEVSETNTPGAKVVTNDSNILGAGKIKESELEVPIALTCGDMSGHRICTSASFFAFEFLMGVLRRLPFVKQTPYVFSLQQRINVVCLGHIKWLEWIRKPWLTHERTGSLLSSGCFAANYWVNGQIMPTDSESWQPDNGITDTPFQIMKITAYVKWFKTAKQIQSLEDPMLTHFMALLRDIWVPWIHELDGSDFRKACAWRHTIEDGLNTYRLDDHIWLWISLDELHDLKLWSLTDSDGKSWKDSRIRWFSDIYSLSPAAKRDGLEPTFDSKKERDLKISADFSSIARRLLPKEVQRAVLQRFTVGNDVSKERMLAVTRSARNTRFFLHSRDTALFYGHARGFFCPNTSFSELWARTIRSQCHHEEAVKEKDSPLRTALDVLAGLNDFSIDQRTSVDLVRHSVATLVQVSAHNGFIPGQVDVTTRRPSIFLEENRDYYYHVGFEVCQILLEFARDIDVSFRSGQTRSHSPAAVAEQAENISHHPQREMTDSFLSEILTPPKKQRMATGNHQGGHDYRALEKVFEAYGHLVSAPVSTIMKKSIPFNNMAHSSTVATLNEEWLYNYPDFLLTNEIDLHHQLKLLFDEASGHYKAVHESVSSIIDKALQSLRRTPPALFSFTTNEEKKWWDGLVASLPKQKNRQRQRGKRYIGASVEFFDRSCPNEKLWDSLREARSAFIAKKRFLWLPANSDPQTALLCWLASTEAEKPAISLFFDRHVEYESLLWDKTSIVLNTWQTELHMSFWVIYDKEQQLHNGLPHPIMAPWPRRSNKELRRASIGFRFDGDFFDRYWTCHFIQYVPGLNIGTFGVPTEWINMLRTEKRFWQRKVLELHLLRNMLNLMLSSSNKILRDIESQLGLQKEILTFFSLTTEAFASSEDLWQTYEEFLQKAEEDVASSLNTLSKWTAREAERVEERLRWTQKDEKRYRGYINILHNHIERQRWDLENCRDRMCKLRETLGTRHDKIRADLDSKREQNIQYFTYVTIIFLPLGFASSFYSMNGAPSSDLIKSLAKLAAAAFAVTAILIFSASIFSAVGRKAKSVAKAVFNVVVNILRFVVNVLGSVINHVILQPLKQHSLNTRQHSLLVKGTVRGTSNEHKPDKTNKFQQAYSKKNWMVSSLFWPAYLFLELPTRAISSAWTALGRGDVSISAVLRVALGISFLPFYAISRVALVLFVNAVLVLKISRLVYQLNKKQLCEEDRMLVAETSGNQISGEQVHRRRPAFTTASEENGDAENDSAGNRALPDHFQELMPTAEPLQLLQSLELRLNQSERTRRIEMMRVLQEVTDIQ